MGNDLAVSPKLHRVEHQEVGQATDGVGGTDQDEDQLVDKLVTQALVPVQQFVGQSERADT